MNKKTIAIIDDNEQIRQVMLECLRFKGFNADGFAQAEQFISAFLDPGVALQNAPDLVIIDLELEARKMQGLDFISRLAEVDYPSEIMAISGNQPSSEWIGNAVCFGAASILTKPFNSFVEFCKKAEEMATIGNNRRLNRLKKKTDYPHYDLEREPRPIFLSYAKEDRALANGIRRNFEFRNIRVWYAPTTIEIGEEWRQRIIAGIDDAIIFMPLLTNKFMESAYCQAEITRFMGRIEDAEKANLYLLPIVSDLSKAHKEDPVIKSIIGKYQYIDFSKQAPIDALSALLLKAENIILRYHKK